MQYYLTGNNSLLKHFTVSQIQKGENVFYIGDTEDVLNRTVSNTVVFDSSREDKYVPWNPLKGNPSLLADTFLDTWYEGNVNAGSAYFRSMEHLYLTTALTVLQVNDLNLFHLPFFLTDKDYRMSLTENVEDLLIRDFWFGKLDEQTVSTIYAKVYSLLLNPNTRRVFSSQKDFLDADVVLVDLDLPVSEKRLLGSLMMSQTNHFVVVENCALYSSKVIMNLIESGQPLLLGFKGRKDLDEELYNKIMDHCVSANTVRRVWGAEVEPTEFDWNKHDRLFTRSSRKADKEIEVFLGEL